MSPPIEDFIRSLGPRGRLRVRWGDKLAGATEVRALRELAPELQAKPVPEALALVRSTSEWVFDELTRNQAKELGRKVTALGLEFITEFPDTP
ncbi:hypothetical protein [Myxococcus landrumensis]|uniref:Uncharacterized protein n=1 Tax=Myxococcus landrumensis TaxID=2813577 RepID=A0ABX7NA32_9BACT|nr:hypothetical protein [Myxococcus landrumus]QSQ15620.1 hypothetical protein JY572_06015 [Myxococcus landrumus]